MPFDAVLGTILYSPDRKLAIIDNRIVGVGDEVRGARVIEITAGAVLLRDAQGSSGGWRLVLEAVERRALCMAQLNYYSWWFRLTFSKLHEALTLIRSKPVRTIEFGSRSIFPEGSGCARKSVSA